jgi:murein L,D-transpeptidase YafK
MNAGRILLWSVLGYLVLMSFTGTNKKMKRTSYPVLSNPYILIDKSDYEMKVYDDKGWYATYPVVFGNNSLEDKKMEGDKLTPEGSFKIASKRPHEKWGWMLLLDYPTKESRARFNDRKAKGIIPKNASIGGGIGIHGTWPHEDYAVDYYMNWTNGCISMKRDDAEEIFHIIPAGTRVTISR